MFRSTEFLWSIFYWHILSKIMPLMQYLRRLPPKSWFCDISSVLFAGSCVDFFFTSHIYAINKYLNLTKYVPIFARIYWYFMSCLWSHGPAQKGLPVAQTTAWWDFQFHMHWLCCWQTELSTKSLPLYLSIKTQESDVLVKTC